MEAEIASSSDDAAWDHDDTYTNDGAIVELGMTILVLFKPRWGHFRLIPSRAKAVSDLDSDVLPP